jgi:hypothetical protein
VSVYLSYPDDMLVNAPWPTAICQDTCIHSSDSMCDDGGSGSMFTACDYGTDCTDCGPRPAVPPSPSPSSRRRTGGVNDPHPEPFKEAPSHRRAMQGVAGCVAVSPSPPSPSPQPSPPPPSLPPAPPFVPLRTGEVIIQAPVTVVGFTLIVQQAVEAMNQTAMRETLVRQTGCLLPCELRITFAPGSTILIVEASTPTAEATAVGAVATAAQRLLTSGTAAIGDALGVKVLQTSSQITSQSRIVPILVAASPPPPPPTPPSPYPPPFATTANLESNASEVSAQSASSKESSSQVIIIVVSAVAAVSALALLGAATVYMLRRRKKRATASTTLVAVQATTGAIKHDDLELSSVSASGAVVDTPEDDTEHV